MHTIYSFAPVSRKDARCLVLGSMPGRKSLDEQAYYAHPRNAFWPIVARLFNFNPVAPYQQRTRAMIDAEVALWDVLAACQRRSSLDSDIVESSIITNDFNSFFQQHPHIDMVCFNGLKAWEAYRKFVKPGLQLQCAVSEIRLPSTSPANARISFEEKFRAWSVILEGVKPISGDDGI